MSLYLTLLFIGVGVVDVLGTGTQVGNVGARLFSGDFTMMGTATPSEIVATFDDTTGGEGNISLTRTVANENASWSELKSDWR